jgi:nucleosome binding factor SPN SPT16 subunit
MRHRLAAAALALAIGLTGSAWGETAIELKKELLPKIKKAEAEGKDLGDAKKEYDEGDKNLRDGLQEEALEHFKKAKAAMPADAK